MPLHEVSCCTKHKFANEGESGEHAESQNSSSKGFTVTNPEKRYAPHLHIEPKHLDISIDATHLEQKLVDIKLTYLLENNTVGASNITFNGLDFADVKVSGDGKPDWTYDGKELQVCFSEPFGAVHEKKSLTIAYRVAHPLVGLHFSVPDEKYPQRPLFAMTDHETEKARYWLACVDYPTVRTSLAYHITAKKGLVVVANGLHEKDEELDVTRVTSHWRLEQRCPSYLICWAVGDFQIEHDKDVHGIPIAYVAPRNVPREVLRSSFAATPSIMNFLETRLGVPFPFPKYYQIAVPGVLGGAMENITLTSWSVFFLCDETWGKEFQLSLDEVNVHEMAHSYFGDSVVMRHFEHVWLKESWATYMESAWLEQHRGDDEFRYEMYSNLNSYVSETNSYVRPMVERRYDHSWDMYDSHTYPGGAWRIHMLRRLLGDDAFWAGVKDYLTTYAGRVVETDDFRKCLEKFSGTNLTKFFDQWYYSAGFPKLKGSYEYKKETNRVKVTLEQTQVDDKSGVALFDIAPVIEIVDEAGKVYRATLVFEGARGSVVVQLEGKPVSVVVDPDYSLLHTLDFNPGTELLKHTLTHSSSMPHRVWAAKELIKNGSYQSLQTVDAAMKTEKFYAVIGETAAALAKSKSPFALDVLVNIITGTQLDKAQTITNLAALSVRHPKIRAAFREYLTRSNLPYRANARALHGLGKQRNEEDVALLIEWAQRPEVLHGLHSIVLAGAIRGLGDSQSRKAWEYLYHAVDEGVLPELARGVAVEALAEISKIDDQCKDKARIKLEQLLMEENYAIRKNAINALVTLKSSSSSGAIKAALISHQDAPWLQRKLKSLAEAKSGEELKGEVSDLTARVLELEKKVQLLKENKPLNNNNN